ncbi:hypothetical protein [Neisseria weixii]|uniref:hypothetical protein n=1 Tax=Neisseria weixii TaxID=1853276 RepID=UPI0013157F30|nr:hypothetical protein [Neisseria weixii]
MEDLGNDISERFDDFKREYDKTLDNLAEKINTTKENLSDTIDNMIDKALDLGDKFGD